MPLLAPRMTASMVSLGASKQFIGSKFYDFCSAVSTAAVISVKGKPFSTVDVGLIVGVGAGVGVGIKALIAPVIQNQIYSIGLGKGFIGSRWRDLCSVIAEATVKEMGLATLTSSHAPVFAGSGTIIPGTIPVVGPAWVSLLQSQGIGKAFVGQNWPKMAEAIALGSATGFPLATGNVAISGFPTVFAIGFPLPGAGVGVGTIS